MNSAASRLARSKTATLAECVPLLAVALEFIDRGPPHSPSRRSRNYRAKRGEDLLESMRPVIERQAKVTLAEWKHRVGDVELRAAA